MSSLRNFVVIVLLAGVLGVVYFAINKGPRTAERSELAPPWASAHANPATGEDANPTAPAAGLAGFPSTAASTSISPGAAPTAAIPSATPTPPSPYPSFAAAPPPATAPSPTPAPVSVTATPSAAETSVVSGPPQPSGTITGLGSVGPAPGASAGPTVILGQTASTPHTVFPARDSPAAQADAAAPASYQQDSPASAPGAATAAPAASSPPAPAPVALGPVFLALMQSIQRKLDAGQLSEAHLELSKYYLGARLNAEEWRVAVDLLDRLAGTVLYSREHLLEAAYRVQPGDTLDRIAMTYGVPAALLAKINGISDPRQLLPGQELKVVRGPFEAVVDLGRHELTLVAGGRYAGRFPVGVGRDRANLEGAFVVRDKRDNPVYFGPDRVIAADDPTNPLGERLLDLGNQVGIHGTPDPTTAGTDAGRGTIRLGQRDVEDVYDILSVGSRVTIRR